MVTTNQHNNNQWLVSINSYHWLVVNNNKNERIVLAYYTIKYKHDWERRNNINLSNPNISFVGM